MTEPADPDDHSLRVLFVTAPEDDADRIVSTLVDERLIACGNIIAGARSIYRWQGDVCRETEAVLLMETDAATVDAAMARLTQLHPYDTPKLIALPVAAVNGDYLAWVRAATGR